MYLGLQVIVVAVPKCIPQQYSVYRRRLKGQKVGERGDSLKNQFELKFLQLACCNKPLKNFKIGQNYMNKNLNDKTSNFK